MIEKRKIYIKNYYKLNKDKILKQQKIYDMLHKTQKKEYMKKYHKLHKLEIYAKRKIKDMHRQNYLYATDINFKLSRILRNRLNCTLRKNLKSSPALELLGCSIEFFKKYLEAKFTNGMSWKNHGNGWYGNPQWHIDHIRPCASFDLSKPEEQKKCFHYTNLQPLWAKDNLSKHDDV